MKPFWCPTRLQILHSLLIWRRLTADCHVQWQPGMRNNWHELGSAFFGTFAFTVPRKRRWDSSELDLDFVEDSFREQQNGSVICRFMSEEFWCSLLVNPSFAIIINPEISRILRSIFINFHCGDLTLLVSKSNLRCLPFFHAQNSRCLSKVCRQLMGLKSARSIWRDSWSIHRGNT